MPEAAEVNERGRSNADAFEGVVSTSPNEIIVLSRAVRDLVYDVLPETVEVVWAGQRSVGWGIGPRKFSEQFCYFMPFTRHVTLGFYYGGELPDPAGLLGAGGRQVGGRLSMRSLKITKLDDVRQPELRTLVKTAVNQILVGRRTPTGHPSIRSSSRSSSRSIRRSV
jgi:hypothetical protein